MRNSLLMIFENRVFLTGCAAWLTSQVIKTILHLIVHKKLVFERLFGDGGMPSSHAATVTAIAVSCGITAGFDTPLFAVAAFLAIIVMHDAHGVRLETGKQAKAINDIREMMEMVMKVSTEDSTPEEKLKELVGHTPLQVAMGFVLGLIVALILNL